MPALLEGEVDDLGRGEPPKTESGHLRSRRKEQPGDVEVACHRPGGKPPLLDEIGAVALKQLIGRRRGGDWLGHRHDSPATKVRQQRRHALGGAPQPVAHGASGDEELLHPVGREIAHIQTSTHQPPADVSHDTQLIAHRVRPIALRLQLRTEPSHIGDKRADDLHPQGISHHCLLSGLHLERKPRPFERSRLG